MDNIFLKRITAQNRKAWNEIAEIRSKTFPPAEYFANGGSTLTEYEIAAVQDAFGNLKKLRIIHLQCATGEDTLSWAVLGAAVGGVDISDEQIHIAEKKAADAALSVRFVAADIYQLPDALPAGWLEDGYDVVFTGGGAIVWLPDLEEWAKVISFLLRPGGRLVLSDEHPLAGCLWMENGQLRVTDDYFRRHKAMEGSGWFHFRDGQNAQENKFEFNWPLGDIVTALAHAGLVIEKLEEFPGGSEWQFGLEQGEMGYLPGKYLLVARKP